MTLGKDLGRDLGKRPWQELYKQKHTTIDCLFFLGLVFRYIESQYQGLCRGLSRGLRGDYTISIFRLHLSRVKIIKQLILCMTLGRDLGKDLGRDLGKNYTTKTYNHRLFILFGFGV